MASEKQIGSNLSNLYFKIRDLEPEIANSYNDNLKDLADPSISKIDSGGKIDQRISYTFKIFPIYSYMQNGMSAGKYDFSEILPYQDIRNIMLDPVSRIQESLEPKVFDISGTEEEKEKKKKEVAKYTASLNSFVVMESTDDTISISDTSFLKAIWDNFAEQNSRENVSQRTRIKNYYFSANFKEVVENYNVSSEFNKDFLVSTSNPRVFKVADRVEKVVVDPKTKARTNKFKASLKI